MKLFKSHDPNTFHYTTSVCHKRVQVFRSDKACELFIEALAETRRRLPLKLIGYVIMPDHIHLIVNPLCCDISKVMNSLHSASAREILDWLRESNYEKALRKLALKVPQKTGSYPFSLAKGLFCYRSLESKIHPPEASLHSHESC